MDGFLVVTPYYNKPPQRGIVAHVEAVAAASDRPVVFYDIPSRVVVDAEPATIAALAEIENVRAVKQAKPSVEAARNVVACGLDLYAGDDDLILPFLEVGGVGGICVHTHLVGPQVKELVASYRAGDIERAHALDEQLRPVIEILRVQTNPIAIKRRSSSSGTRSAACVFRSSRPTKPRRRDPRVPREARAARRGRIAVRDSTRALFDALMGAFAGVPALPASGCPGSPGPSRRAPVGRRHHGRRARADRGDGELRRARRRDARRRRRHPDGSVTPVADAVEKDSAPYEAAGVRREDEDGLWRVAAVSVLVAPADPGETERVELARVGGEISATVDGTEAPAGSAPPGLLELLDGLDGDAALTAERLDETAWVARAGRSESPTGGIAVEQRP